MKISLIIAAYNEEKYIQACLNSVIKNSEGRLHEIIVVDNNSTDNTRKIAEKDKRVKVITELRKGPQYARQKGFEVATGEILAFIDADNQMPKGWINIIINEFKNNQKICCLSGPYVYYDLPKWKNLLSTSFWNMLVYPTYLLVGYMTNAGNVVIKKEVLKKMKGIDTSIAFYGDDTNFARRASKFGKVKFKLGFVMHSSARRLIGQGATNTVFFYTLNFWSQVLLKKSVTKSYRDIR